MKVLDQASIGIFVYPTTIADEVANQYGIMQIGQTEDIREMFLAISVGGRISHPVVARITESARQWLK